MDVGKLNSHHNVCILLQLASYIQHFVSEIWFIHEDMICSFHLLHSVCHTSKFMYLIFLLLGNSYFSYYNCCNEYFCMCLLILICWLEVQIVGALFYKCQLRQVGWPCSSVPNVSDFLLYYNPKCLFLIRELHNK